MDKFTKEQRHKCMSRIGGKDTLPELLVRKRLFSCGWRYRVCDRRFPGRPDIVIPKAKTIVDVRGCFWHRHGCKAATMPKSNVKFWIEKWSKNVKRDIRKEEAWREAGWNLIIVWQYSLFGEKRKKRWSASAKRLIYGLRNLLQESCAAFRIGWNFRI